MRINVARREPKQRPFRVRRGDSTRRAFAAAGLAGMMLVLFLAAARMEFFPTASLPATAEADAAILAEADALAEAQERRVGSIVFASYGMYCEERLFDNLTGRLLAFNKVDCESRLVRASDTEAPAAKTARMRGVLASFKR